MKHPSLRWTSSATWIHPQLIWFLLYSYVSFIDTVNSWVQAQSIAVMGLIIIRGFNQEKLLLHCSFRGAYFIAFVCCTQPQWATSVDTLYQLPSSPFFLTSLTQASCCTQQPIQGFNNNTTTKLIMPNINNIVYNLCSVRLKQSKISNWGKKETWIIHFSPPLAWLKQQTSFFLYLVP